MRDVPAPNISRDRGGLLGHLAEIGASAQAAIPGIYAWAVTVAPAAWVRGAPMAAKVAALVGVLALLTAPIVERIGRPAGKAGSHHRWQLDPTTAPQWARIWSVWGLVLSSALVWVLVPSPLWSARLDAVRGILGILGWALFAFASAGPSLRRGPDVHEAIPRVLAGTPLVPRSRIPRGDGIYLVFGVLTTLGMQVVGWSITVPERAVLVRLVTVASGVAVLGATTSVTLARHAVRVHASRRLRFRRALPWLVMLMLFTGSGLLLAFAR